MSNVLTKFAFIDTNINIKPEQYFTEDVLSVPPPRKIGNPSGDEMKIIKMAHDYNFYAEDITARLIFLNSKPDKFAIYNTLYEWGFIIRTVFHHKNIFNYALQLEYMFVKPDYRKMGIMTAVINECKKKYKFIHFATNVKYLFPVLEKLGFVNCGLPSCVEDKTERSFKWASKKYNKQQLRTCNGAFIDQ